MKKVIIIHTSPATIQPLSALANQYIPGVEIVNLLDDSILKDLIAGHRVDLVEKRWIAYAEMGQLMGGDAVLSACSSVGEITEKADRQLRIPVYRIDEAMAEKAVGMGGRISVFATLSTTLNPTVSLIQQKAQLSHTDCTVQTYLVEGAYEQLMLGNRDEHNRRIRELALECMGSSDVIVLAQASMASALEGMDEALLSKVLTSPEIGIMRLRENLV